MNYRRMDPFMLLFLALMLFYGIRQGMYSGNPQEWLLGKLFILPGIVIGLSVHEFAHADVAYRLGDNTPLYQGRRTLNPAAHFDLVGFLALIFVGFGWGKPVEIDPRNFRNPRSSELLVALAGVVTNLITAFVFTLILKLYISAAGIVYVDMTSLTGIIYYMILYTIQINLVLMIFNLIPVPPLDGFNIVTEIFNLRRYSWYWNVYRYGWFILMILIMCNFTDVVLYKGVDFFWGILANLL
ncbi:MAG: site-2 protease family protein [Anaerovoracaceae bacterium]